CFATYDKI
ncbi:hypothetical protein SNEBB_003390, partial [Seison nebaliae]